MCVCSGMLRRVFFFFGFGSLLTYIDGGFGFILWAAVTAVFMYTNAIDSYGWNLCFAMRIDGFFVENMNGLKCLEFLYWIL